MLSVADPRPPLDAETLRDLGQTIHRFWQLGARIRVEASREGRPVVIAEQSERGAESWSAAGRTR